MSKGNKGKKTKFFGNISNYLSQKSSQIGNSSAGILEDKLGRYWHSGSSTAARIEGFGCYFVSESKPFGCITGLCFLEQTSETKELILRTVPLPS